MDTRVIAEAGVNHNGDMTLAHQLVDAAADAGANAVKFQTFVPTQLASRHAGKAGYQKRTTSNSENQLQMLQGLCLPFAAHHELLAHCAKRNIEFLSSPFDLPSADFLINELQLGTIKLGSGELTNGPLLWKLARSRCELILSTGMATLAEIKEALGLICHAIRTDGEQPQTNDFPRCFDQALLQHRVTLLHCTTEYPCPPESVNLLAMDTLADTFGLPVGYSDHTVGLPVSLAAAARGARIIEKHFTLDRELPGPDHSASLLPAELAELVGQIRTVTTALGSAAKQPGPVELENAQVARKSLCAAGKIRKGEVFSQDKLLSKRPGSGISPMRYWSLLGKPAKRAYAEDELLESGELPLQP